VEVELRQERLHGGRSPGEQRQHAALEALVEAPQAGTLDRDGAHRRSDRAGFAVTVAIAGVGRAWQHLGRAPLGPEPPQEGGNLLLEEIL